MSDRDSNMFARGEEKRLTDFSRECPDSGRADATRVRLFDNRSGSSSRINQNLPVNRLAGSNPTPQPPNQVQADCKAGLEQSAFSQTMQNER